MPFSDRTDAGRRLAAALREYRGADTVVLALPRGGVPVAAEIAAALGAPLDLLLVRKIGVPRQPELAMGAVVDGAEPVIVRNEAIIREAKVTQAGFDAVCRRELEELERRRRRYLGDRAPAEVAGRTAIVVDDGIATGATVRAAVRGLRLRKPRRIVIAAPVAAPDTVASLAAEADEIVCLDQPARLRAIGYHYRDFGQLEDEDVVALLDAAARDRERRG